MVSTCFNHLKCLKFPTGIVLLGVCRREISSGPCEESFPVPAELIGRSNKNWEILCKWRRILTTSASGEWYENGFTHYISLQKYPLLHKLLIVNGKILIGWTMFHGQFIALQAFYSRLLESMDIVFGGGKCCLTVLFAALKNPWTINTMDISTIDPT